MKDSNFNQVQANFPFAQLVDGQALAPYFNKFYQQDRVSVYEEDEEGQIRLADERPLNGAKEGALFAEYLSQPSCGYIGRFIPT